MNIKVIMDSTMPTEETGGEYAVSCLEIRVDPRLSERTQRELIIHAVLENFLQCLEHKAIDKLTDYIQEALDLWEENNGH